MNPIDFFQDSVGDPGEEKGLGQGLEGARRNKDDREKEKQDGVKVDQVSRMSLQIICVLQYEQQKWSNGTTSLRVRATT